MNARYILPNFQENGDHVSDFVLDTDTLIFILCGPTSCHMVSSPPLSAGRELGVGAEQIWKKYYFWVRGVGIEWVSSPSGGWTLGRLLPGSMSKNDHFLLFDLEI